MRPLTGAVLNVCDRTDPELAALPKVHFVSLLMVSALSAVVMDDPG